MTDARTDILARLKRGRREYPATPAPNRTSVAADLEAFRRNLEKVSATHETVADKQQIRTAIEAFVKQHDEHNTLVVAPAIHEMGLLNGSTLQTLPAPTRADETCVVSLAYAGIAETGSLVMLSSADTPMTSNFLPENFICLLKTKHLLQDMEALWARMKHEQQSMPRSMNIITGPSRTADVEQIIQMGAHGPRRVHVILWDRSD